MLLKNLLLVGLGGGLGSMARFLVQQYSAQVWNPQFPYGTFLVNISGCLLIGIFAGCAERFSLFTPAVRILLMSGFCGGFTTFSAFTLEGMNLIQHHRLPAFFLYFAGSILIGIAATFIGYWISK